MLGVESSIFFIFEEQFLFFCFSSEGGGANSVQEYMNWCSRGSTESHGWHVLYLQ